MTAPLEPTHKRLPESGTVFGLVAGALIALLVALAVMPTRASRQKVLSTRPERSAASSGASGAAAGAAPGADASSAAGGAATGTGADGTPVGSAASATGGGTHAGSSGTPKGSSGGASPGAAPAPGAAGSPAGPAARGVTASAIRIGVAYLDLGPVAALGPEYDNGDVPSQWQAVLDDYKRRHLLPVNGRTIEFAFRKYSVLSTEEQRSACVGLVEDDKVFAVIAPEFFYQAGAECVAREMKTPLLTAEGPTDDVFAGSSPMLFSVTGSISSQLRNWVAWANAKGFFKNHRVGLYHASDSVTEREVTQNVKAPMAKLGYSLAAEAETDQSLGGPQDALAVQKFRAANVDVVMLMTSRGGFMQQAAAQAWKPAYVDSDFDGGTSDVGTTTYPADQFDGSLGMTETRRGEYAAGAPLSPDEEQCVSNYERFSGKKVVRPGHGGHEDAVWVFVVLACDEVKIAYQALQAAGPALTQASYLSGLEKLQNVPLIRFPDVTYGPSKHQGVTQQRTLQWHKDCTCWRALGGLSPLFTP